MILGRFLFFGPSMSFIPWDWIAWLAVYLAQPPLASKARLAGICMDYGNLGEGHLAADKAMLQRFCFRMP